MYNSIMHANVLLRGNTHKMVREEKSAARLNLSLFLFLHSKYGSCISLQSCGIQHIEKEASTYK